MLENVYVARQKGFNKVMQEATAHTTRRINQKVEKETKALKRKPDFKQEPVKRKKSDSVSITSESLDIVTTNQPEKKHNNKAAQGKKNKLKFV
jgi:hypothetical protein